MGLPTNQRHKVPSQGHDTSQVGHKIRIQSPPGFHDQKLFYPITYSFAAGSLSPLASSGNMAPLGFHLTTLVWLAVLAPFFAVGRR